jgi:hypothetical protein
VIAVVFVPYTQVKCQNLCQDIETLLCVRCNCQEGCRNLGDWCSQTWTSIARWLADKLDRLVALIWHCVDRLRCGRPKRLLIFDAINLSLFVTTALSLAQFEFWIDDDLNPLAVFGRDTFIQWGIPVDNFNMGPFLAAIAQWKLLGYYVSLYTLIALAVLVLLRSVMVKPPPDRLMLLVLLLVWLAQFGVYFVYPLFVHFAQLITLRADSVDYLRKHPNETTTVTKVRKDLSECCVSLGVVDGEMLPGGQTFCGCIFSIRARGSRLNTF